MQGPTYAEWWPPGDFHPLAYHHMNTSLLNHARSASVYHNVSCRWGAALISASAQFGTVGSASWIPMVPYLGMAKTCPLFMRKVMPTATEEFMRLLWPESNVTVGGQA